jgi:hypothetical protein
LSPFDLASHRLQRLVAYVCSDSIFHWAVLFGLSIRLLLAVATTNSYDLWFFGSVADDGAFHRPLYADTTFSYPPLWGYAFEDAGKILAFLHTPVFKHVPELDRYAIPGLTKADLTTPFASLLLKLPSQLVEAALGLMMYVMALRYGLGLPAARRVALAWWLNPLALVTSPVEANWDAAVPLAFFAGIVCALEERWVLVGSIVTIGIAAKLTPLYFVFLLPALAAMPAASGSGLLQRAARRLALASAGALVTGFLIFIPILHWQEPEAMLRAVFSRTGTFGIGGANVLAFAQLDEARPFENWVASVRQVYVLVSLGAMVAGCLCASILLARRASRNIGDYCAAAVAILASICIASPFAQPTYALWIVPLTAFIAAGGDRRWWWPTWMLTFAGFAFFVTVRAPQALLEPSCVFFHLCDPAAFGERYVAYRNAFGLGANSLQVTIDVFAGEVLGCTILATFALALVRLARGSAGPQTIAGSGRPRAQRPTIELATSIALLAVCGGAIAPYPPVPHFASRPDGNRVVLSAAGYSGTAYVTSVLEPTSSIAEIDAYFDRRYASLRGVTATFAAGFPAHFRDALQRRGLDVPFRLLDAIALRRLLEHGAQHHVLFVLGGTLPDIVRDKGRDLLRPWLERGGVVFWAGGPFDIIWSQRDAVGARSPFRGPDYAEWPDLYPRRGNGIFGARVNVFYPPVTTASYADRAWYASRIDFVRTTYPLNDGPLIARGGRALAYVDAHTNSSVSSFQVGNGTVVFFADAFDDEIAASQTLAQLLFANVWSPSVRYAFTDGKLEDGGGPMTLVSLPKGSTLSVYGDLGASGPFLRIGPVKAR